MLDVSIRVLVSFRKDLPLLISLYIDSRYYNKDDVHLDRQQNFIFNSSPLSSSCLLENLKKKRLIIERSGEAFAKFNI